MEAIKILFVLLCILDIGTGFGQFPFWWRPRPRRTPRCPPVRFCPKNAQIYQPCRTDKGPRRGMCVPDEGCRQPRCRLLCSEGSPCKPLPTISNGYFVLDDITDVTLGATATINCVEGYASRRAKITCQADRTWSNPRAACKAISCGPVPQVDYGEYVIADDVGAFGSLAYLNCTLGFIPVSGENACIQCLSNGQWSPSQTSCMPEFYK